MATKAWSAETARTASESAMVGVRQTVFRRWLEIVLPLYTIGLVAVWFRPEYTPAVFTERMTASPLPWVAWGVVGAMTGVFGLWALIVAFFLLYSPLYLLGKAPFLIGRGGWVDRREVRFYLATFAVLCALAVILYLDPAAGVGAFALAAGCGPVFWRVLV